MQLVFWLMLVALSFDPATMSTGRHPFVPRPKQYESHHCVTPLNETGTCIDIRSCPELYGSLRLFSTAKWNPRLASFLRRSQCGFQNNAPHVCCHNGSNSNTIVENSFQPTEITIQSGLFHRSPSGSSNNWSECGMSTKKRTRDRNPKNATAGDWPWVAALGYQNSIFPGIDFKCGATLISDRWIITAAHCVRNIGSFELSVVRLGEVDLNPVVDDKVDTIDVPIEDIIVHPDYSTNPMTNDIALLLLSNTVQFTSNIRPACLLSGARYQDDDWYKRKAPFILGWGAINWSSAASTKLQEYTIPIINSTRCAEAFADHPESQIDGKVLCAGELYKDPCQGDSGGMLAFPVGFEKFYLGGIISYGIRCTDPNTPTGGVYTKVAAFTDWISQNTGLTFPAVIESA